MKTIRYSAVLVCWMALCVVGQAVASDDEPNALQRVLSSGALTVAVYDDFPPYSYRDAKGRMVGIDVSVAKALAERLGVGAVIRAVGADESMEDDLRNNVWKGHYLGGGVADIMLHVPVDKAFAQENDRVVILAPYFREQIVVATTQVLAGAPLEAFDEQRVGVELDTMADFFLLSARGGAMRNQVVHYRNMGEAVEALKRGELAGVAGPRAEVEFALGEQRKDYVVQALPGLGRGGWDLGAAVKQGNDELASEIAAGMQRLRDGGVIERIFSQHHATYQAPVQDKPAAIAGDTDLAMTDAPEGCKRRP